MQCAHFDGLSNVEYINRFNHRVRNERVPLSGSIAITHRCNVGCLHCYVGDKARHYAGRVEMTTPRILDLIDEIADAGCLFLLITGGEPTMHKGFAEIYTRAKRRGMLITVFTNATLVTDELIDLFKHLPPYNVDVSVYGATEETYESITRVPGSHGRFMAGIRKLKDNGLNLSLKTVLMTLNSHEYYQIEQMADDFDVQFRVDAALFPRFNGDPMPLKYRVSPKEAIEKEFSNRQRAMKWKSYVEDRKDMPSSDKVYTCGSGQSTFHIDPCGKLQPCLMSVHQTVDLNQMSFLDAWATFGPDVRAKTLSPESTFQGGCGSCGGSCESDNDEVFENQTERRLLSGYCPAFSQLEVGADDQASPYMDALGKERRHAINELSLSDATA